MEPTASDFFKSFPGKYEFKALLGYGGSGYVYSAVDLHMQRPVAIKILTKRSSAVDSLRFERECRTLSQSISPHIPKIYAWGVTEDRFPFLVMELLAGSPGDKLSFSLTYDEVTELGIQICDALENLHEAGFVHRDVKPQNIMVDRDETGKVVGKLIDFGIVHALGREQSLTGTNDVLGSLDYLSPEHFTPRELDRRSDIFSLGCTLHFLITQKPPYREDSLTTLLEKIAKEERSPLPTDCPAFLRQSVSKCLKKCPAERFQNATELKLALSSRSAAAQNPELFSGRTTKSVKWLLLVILTGVCVAVIVRKTSDSSSEPSSALIAPRAAELSRKLIDAVQAKDVNTLKIVVKQTTNMSSERSLAENLINASVVLREAQALDEAYIALSTAHKLISQGRGDVKLRLRYQMEGICYKIASNQVNDSTVIEVEKMHSQCKANFRIRSAASGLLGGHSSFFENKAFSLDLAGKTI
ncbi:MAG: serine/threonine protein kinase [Candidatus Obscuribacterales bacterium]|nr:serine/threonine protein kinase [Candidatus Obscuribacterales bacterium]